MRYGIFSDIHGNWEALQAVLDACRNDGVRHFFCAGDVVGYGADPLECLKEVKRIKAPTVAGNHDWAVCGKTDIRYFNPIAKEAVHWTRRQLSDQELNELAEWDLSFEHQDFTMVHASLNDPQLFRYITDISLAADTFYLMNTSVCFIGHTHVPQIFQMRDGNVRYLKDLVFDIDKKSKYVVNIGSVGQPRDGNPQAAYCLFDPDLNRIEIKRVPYDIKEAQSKIIAAGLPEMLAQRLSIGQ